MTAVTSGAENQKARQGRTETDTDSGTRRFSPFPSVTDALRSLRKFPAEAQNVEGVLILRNSSFKPKTVVDNAILLNYAVSSENISESIKKRENDFYLKRNVCIFRRNGNCPQKIIAPSTFC